jgi:hypothetical protein
MSMTFPGRFLLGQLVVTADSSFATITGGTIPTAGMGLTRCSPAGAITGVILQQGTLDGQIIIVENDAAAANTITFAAAGTSFVANGVTTVIAGLTAVAYVWNATTSLWYPIV